MQGNGYGPYDPFAQERKPNEYTNRNQRQQAPRPQQGSPRAPQQAPQRRQMPQYPLQQHVPQPYAAPEQDHFRQNVQKPAPPQPQYQQYEQDAVYDLDVVNTASMPSTPSHDMPFVAGGPKVKSAVIASVLALVIACGGFVTSRIKAQKAEDAASQNAQQNVAAEDAEDSPIIPAEEAAQVTAVELNTTLPQFGSARLQITFTVDADAVVRVEILKADGSVFCVVEDAMEVTEGKLRTYFDGKDSQGNWIAIGSYQVRVSSLMAPEGAQDAAQSTEGTAAVNWKVDNSKTVDFTVSADARPTQNSRPATIATPTPSPSLTPEVSPSPDASQTTTPTPDVSQTTPTPSATQTATPTPATPTPAPPTPEAGEGDAPPVD